MTRLGWVVVRGRSMEPTLHDGDRILVRYDARVRPGRLVVARLPDGAVAIKRAVERRTTVSGEPGWWLLSDNPEEGIDSRHRGPIPDTAVLAVAVRRLWLLLGRPQT